MRICIHLPTRGRPLAAAQSVARWSDATADKENTFLLVSVDDDDDTMAGLREDPEDNFVVIGRGASKNKVFAINRDIDCFPWDVLVVASDDLYPMTPGFDQAIRTDFANEAPDLDAMFWYPDSNQRICCHPVIGRKYYEREGYVGDPAFKAFYCLPEDCQVSMANHTFKPISEVRVGESVVGALHRCGPGAKKGNERPFLTPTKVTAIHSRIASIVKMTLASGKIIRCTPDHAWAYYADSRVLGGAGKSNRKRAPHKGIYARATTLKSKMFYGEPVIGRPLVHVMDIPEPPPNFTTTIRDLGWMAGIFDGEGSFPYISQSHSHNPPVCREISRLLNKYGFEHSEEIRPNGMTYFCLRGGRQAYLRFLTWVRPIRTYTKQVSKRMFAGRYGTADEIVSIEPEPFPVPVYCLTTDTGNYVANGYLSHNCDDLWTILAQKRGKLYKSTSVKWLHLHPNYGNRKPDATDARGKAHLQADYRLFCTKQSKIYGFTK